jgi:uncharacterized membrane protein YdbT with pleckstrin-like domain
MITSFNVAPFRSRPFEVLFLGWLIFPLVFWYFISKFEKVEITENEIHYQKGIFSKTRVDLRKNQIRSIVTNQTFLNRIFNCGNLQIYTSGDKPELTLENFPNPDQIEKQLKGLEKNDKT